MENDIGKDESFTGVDTTAGVCLTDFEADEDRQHGFELLPDPSGEHLGGG